MTFTVCKKLGIVTILESGTQEVQLLYHFR